MAATPLVFGPMIDHLGWPRAFQAAGGATIAVALVWTLVAANHPTTAAPGVQKGSTTGERPSFTFVSRSMAEVVRPTRVLDLLMDRSLMCLTISYGMVGYFQYLFFYWAQYYFENVQKMPKEEARLMTGLLILSMGAGMVVGGWVSDRASGFFGPRGGLAVVPVVGLFLGAVATIFGVLNPNPALIGGCFAVAMAAVGLGEGAFWTAAVRIGGARGGTAAAILNTGGNAGGLLAPALTPFIRRSSAGRWAWGWPALPACWERRCGWASGQPRRWHPNRDDALALLERWTVPALNRREANLRSAPRCSILYSPVMDAVKDVALSQPRSLEDASRRQTADDENIRRAHDRWRCKGSHE